MRYGVGWRRTLEEVHDKNSRDPLFSFSFSSGRPFIMPLCLPRPRLPLPCCTPACAHYAAPPVLRCAIPQVRRLLMRYGVG